MVSFLRAYFRWYPVNAANIQLIVQDQSFALLRILLKRSKHKERRIILETLSRINVDTLTLDKLLVNIMSKDSLRNAELAAQILEKRMIMDPHFEQLLRNAKLILSERKRRWENKIKAAEQYDSTSSKSMVDNKMKMQQLHRVKQQLKKGMRLH